MVWARLKSILWQERGILVTTPPVAAAVILLRLAGLLQAWEWAAFDQYMRLRPPDPQEPKIAIVGINETDLKEVKSSIISDEVLATLLKKLTAMEPEAIGLDLYRNLPEKLGHEELVTVYKSTPNLIGIQKVIGDQDQDTVDPPPELAEKKQVGANDFIRDGDQRIRRSFLTVRNPQENNADILGLATYLAYYYLQGRNITIQAAPGTDNWWQAGQALFRPFHRNDGGYVNTDAGDYQILINYRSGKDHFEMVSLTDILEDRVPPDWGRDRIILIGKVGESSKDIFFTPLSSQLIGLAQPMAGVEIHAHITSQIIDAVEGKRPLIQTWSEFWEWCWILLWSALGATLTWKGRNIQQSQRFPWQRLLLPGFTLTSLLGSTYVAFLWGWWIPVIPPLLSLTASSVGVTVYLAYIAGQIRKTFGRYLNDEVVATLLENPEGLKIGGERRKITILTSDLRGFTALSEQRSPEEVVKILNFYLGCMTDVITEYQGTIDEFMGDGILVLFGAPTPREDDSKRAVACAVAMQLAMERVNQQMQQWNFPKLQMGIGINTGEVVVGNIGSEKRTKYSVIGSQVNLTYRIESYTVGGQILISESTLQEVKSQVRIDQQKQVHPKGVKQPITIFEIGGIDDSYNLNLPLQAPEKFVPLPQEIKIQYFLLEEKHISNQGQLGNIIQLSTTGAKIRPHNMIQNALPEALTNIKLNLFNSDKSPQLSEDIYGKVVEKSSETGEFMIHFTSLPPQVERQFNTIYNWMMTKSLETADSNQHHL